MSIDHLIAMLQDQQLLLSIGLPMCLGAWAVWRLGRPPIAAADRRRVLQVAAFVGVIGLLFGIVVLGGLQGLYTGRPDYLVGLVFGIAIGTIIPLCGVAGYALLAARGHRHAAWISFVVAPFVLLAGPTVLIDQLRSVDEAGLVEQNERDIAARSTFLTVRVDDAVVSRGSDNNPSSVVITYTVHSDLGFDLFTETRSTPAVTLYDERGADLSGWVGTPWASPVTSADGMETRYRARFSWEGSLPAPMGQWTFAVGLYGTGAIDEPILYLATTTLYIQ